MQELTIELGLKLGFHWNNIASLRKRGAVVIDGVVYAPVKRRKKKPSL